MKEPQHLLALAPAVKHHRDSAKIHAIRRHEQQVATHAIEFRQQHAHPLRSFRNVTINAEQFFGGQREHQFIVERRQVIHPRDVGAALHEAERLARFFHAGVQVSNDRLATQDGFALQLQHQSQHAVRAGVLRTHIDNHRLVFLRVACHISQRCCGRLTHAKYRARFTHERFL